MNSNPPPSLWPRLTRDQAMETLARIGHLSISALRDASTTSVEDTTYYHLAHDRATNGQVASVRQAIRRVAEENGYPAPQSPRTRIQFDQELSVELFRVLHLMPSDAADEGVWSFLSLRVAPDVAFWRYPPTDQSVGDGSQITYERHVGKPRNVFRRLWWRSFVLTPALSSRLLEDEAVGIMERPTIGGFPPLARAIAARQLEIVTHTGGARRQDLLRDVLKRVRRVMGNRSVYALREDQLDRLVGELFDRSYSSLFGAPLAGLRTGGTSLGIRQLDSPSIKPHNEDTIRAFAESCGVLWGEVQPLMIEPSLSEALGMRQELSTYKAANVLNFGMAESIETSLQGLFEMWPQLSPDEQSIVYAAASYFVTHEDYSPDRYLNGLDDDNQVVDAAFAALGLVRDV